MLLQTGQFQNVSIKNNVAVEQPNDSVEAYTFWVDTAHTLAFTNNTTVNSAYGNLVTIAQTGQDYPSDTGATAANNLTDATWDNADCNFSGDVTQSVTTRVTRVAASQFNGQWQNTPTRHGRRIRRRRRAGISPRICRASATKATSARNADPRPLRRQMTAQPAGPGLLSETASEQRTPKRSGLSERRLRDRRRDPASDAELVDDPPDDDSGPMDVELR